MYSVNYIQNYQTLMLLRFEPIFCAFLNTKFAFHSYANKFMYICIVRNTKCIT